MGTGAFSDVVSIHLMADSLMQNLSQNIKHQRLGTRAPLLVAAAGGDRRKLAHLICILITNEYYKRISRRHNTETIH